MKRFPTIRTGVDGFLRLKLHGVEWLGARVVDQDEADDQLPKLLATAAVKRFVSYEPALGPVDFREWLFTAREIASMDDQFIEPQESARSTKIDWLIVGGESGPGARPMHPSWVRSVRDQCRAAGTAFFFKQWGAWRFPHVGEEYNTELGRAANPPAFLVALDGTVHCTRDAAGPDAVVMICRGGKNADPSEWPEDMRVREVPT